MQRFEKGGNLEMRNLTVCLELILVKQIRITLWVSLSWHRMRADAMQDVAHL